jgi:hypothetical protein
LKGLNSSIRRSVFGLLLIAAIVELLDLTAISNFQLGPIQFSDLTLVHKLLPVVASYLIYDVWLTAIRYAYALGIAAKFDRIFRPGLAASPFVGLIYPSAPNILVPLPPYKHKTVVLRLIQNFNLFFKVAVSITPFLLVAYWYVRLFSEFGYRDFALYVSAALSIYMLLYAALLAWQGGKERILNARNIVYGEFPVIN